MRAKPGIEVVSTTKGDGYALGYAAWCRGEEVLPGLESYIDGHLNGC